MGFIPGDSENFITVDCILTKAGRQLLARGGDQFKVAKFCFSDDEIDYRLYNQSTGSVAQDANILNTVVLEAFTNEDIQVKYPMISVADPTQKFLPTMKANVESLTLNEMTDASVGKTLEFSQDTILTGKRVQAEIVDSTFIINMDHDLLAIDGEIPASIYPDGLANYVLPRTGTNSVGGAKIVINVIVKALTTDLWQRYGTGTVGSRSITAKVECVGIISGMNKSVTVTISEAYSRTA